MQYSRDFETGATAEEDLRANYDNIQHPIAFAGITAIRRWYKKKLSVARIQNVLSSFESYTLHKEIKEGRRNPIFLYLPRWRMEIDLLDVAKYKIKNQGTTFLVMLIDCWTRKLWVHPITKKSADEVLAAVKIMFQDAGKHPKYLGGDRGLEFTNKKMSQYCTENGIIYTPNFNYVHSAFVERANRTFQKIMYTWMTENETETYLPHLEALAKLYNNRNNRTIMMTPNEAEKTENHFQLRKNLEKKYIKILRRRQKMHPKFKVGDTVRIARSKGHFSRSYQEQFQQEQFRVAQVNKRLPIPTYTLSNFNGDEIIKGNFYGFEMTHVRTNIYRIDRVLRTRKKGKKKEYFVRWKGFGPEHDSWVQQEDFTQEF